MKTADIVRIEKRTAIMFSDGSIIVHPENWPMEKVYAEREESDRNAKPENRSKVAKVSIVIDEILLDPTNPSAVQEVCRSCSQLKEESWAYCPYCGAQSTKLVSVTRG